MAMRRWWMALVAVVGIWMVGASAAWARDDGGYQVLDARYGTAEYSADVTQRVRDMVQRDGSFRVGNDTFGIDPHPKQPKVLRIQARGRGGEMRVFDFPEDAYVDGRMFRGSGGGGSWNQGGWQGDGGSGRPNPGHDDGQYQILQASYGTAERHVDVTQRLRELARRDRSFRLTNETFQVDPHRGHTKTLRIYARGRDGSQRVFDYVEGSWVDGALFTGWSGGNWGQGGWSGGWGGGGDVAPGYGGLQILQATYGVGDRMIEVTARLRSQVRGGRLDVRADNDLAGWDPAPGVPKMLYVTYSVNGRESRVRVRESDYLSLP
ncbi:DNAJC11 domain-containing protein [Acidovorax lacteus]